MRVVLLASVRLVAAYSSQSITNGHRAAARYGGDGTVKARGRIQLDALDPKVS